MIKKIVLWGFGLVCVAGLSSSVLADQSIGYRQYFNEGVKAFKEHDDQKALRYFKIAQIYDPSDEELNRYLSILAHRGLVLEVQSSQLSVEDSMGYKYYFNEALKALQNHDYKNAIHYFKIAKTYDPASNEADRYLRKLSIQNVIQEPKQANVLPKLQQVQPVSSPELTPEVESIKPSQEIVQPSPLPQSQPQPPVVTPQPVVYVQAQKAKQPLAVISLAQITNNGQIKPKLQIEYQSSVIIEAKNIQRFLVVDEGFIRTRIIDADHLEIDAIAIGPTFLHVWDDLGRLTLYVEVIFPKSVISGTLQAMNGIQHSQPFTVTYSNDWSTYYSGKNIPDLKRQSYDFEQSLGLKGETPYGFFDTSGSYSDFDSFSEFDTYTIGLSHIPLSGTSNFNLRGFDSLRYLSPLTMPGTILRGAFADVDLLGDVLGLSVSHGQEQIPLGFISMGGTQFNNSYIDAAKLTLFPKSNYDRYSFNFATSYGSDRPRYLSDHVYSVEGQHKFNDFLTLNAEEGSDGSHDSSLASLKWQKGVFKTGLNFRNIDKDYSTISTLPSYQGETGAAWTTDAEFENIQANSFVEAYRDRLDSNPDDSSALNYDANGHLRANITQNFWSDSDFNYVDTAGELSPNRSLGLNEQLSRSFGVWNSLKGTVFAGGGYQNSHSSGSDVSNYDREDAVAGLSLPLTNQVSSFFNYEYDWLDQQGFGNSNPNVISAGFEYQKQFTPKFSVNSQVSYRDELGVHGTNSFLSGEESVIITSGFNYNPTPDVNFFADGDVSKVLSHTGNPSYDDFEVHLGVRITFGGASYWDPLGTVVGVVFKDKNGDGRFVTGDEGIPGVKVKVGDKVALTDKNGHYSMQIRAKGVDVVPVLDSIPGGLLFSTPQTLNVEVFQGRKTQADFGLISQTGIYGIVFVDKNGTGVPTSEDKFIGKVKVILDGKIVQKSDSQGAFYFRKVTPGEHIISIDINTIALNMVPLLKLENKIDVAEGTNYMFNIPLQIKQQEGEQE